MSRIEPNDTSEGIQRKSIKIIVMLKLDRRIRVCISNQCIHLMIRREKSFEKFCSYRFGREAEFIVAVFLKAKGWKLNISKGSRGPADIIAIRDPLRWLIQIKSSNLIPRIKGYEIRRLAEVAEFVGASAVIATLQPSFTVMFEEIEIGNPNLANGVYLIGDYSLIFYLLPDFSRLIL
jgi:Holliday junction resolvase